MPTAVKANKHMTFQANMGLGRHGWLRLTPAYSVQIVRERIAHEPKGSKILDPFSGTGTTPLVAAEMGFKGVSVDVNPFLLWLGNAKLRNYSDDQIEVATTAVSEVVAKAKKRLGQELWQPNLYKIEKWWNLSNLNALKAIRSGIDEILPEGPARDLLEIAFCRSVIKTSSASFSHQSMSFKDIEHDHQSWDKSEAKQVLEAYKEIAFEIIQSVQFDLKGTGKVVRGDSRNLKSISKMKFDAIITSPPYVNRMSYIRELRPYMYWLRFLDLASDAGELDWKAIGGTWGTASSKLNSWEPSQGTPIDKQLDKVRSSIIRDGGKNGPLLSNYVAKYFHDMWEHFQAIEPLINSGGRLSYIVGNSTFYGNVVPAEIWYSNMLKALDFKNVNVATIRKRNSNKQLFEFDVSAIRN